LDISRAQSHTYSRGDRGDGDIEPFDAENIANGTSNPNPIEPSGYAAYVAPFRISPKLFRGISFNSSGSCLTEKDMANKLSEIMLRVYKNDPKLILPVYDIHGGLIWPVHLIPVYAKMFAFENDIRKSKNQKELTIHELKDICYELLSEEDREELKTIDPNQTLNFLISEVENKGIKLLDLLAEKRIPKQASEDLES